jgi:hypothetical protein
MRFTELPDVVVMLVFPPLGEVKGEEVAVAKETQFALVPVPPPPTTIERTVPEVTLLPKTSSTPPPPPPAP